jgi:copper chaperone CopZ
MCNVRDRTKEVKRFRYLSKKRPMKYWSLVFVAMAGAMLLLSEYNETDADPPVELGKVKWLRNFDEGLRKSAQLDKPVFLLFQEVPGCATCQHYGQQVLSHPLIVEAIEEYFVPVAIYNNKGGKDAEVLKYYDEPSWNNPVVRIVDHDRLDIMPRLSGDYSPRAVVQQMAFALERRGKPVPAYLRLLHEELTARSGGSEQATFAMYCFWTGEKQLGQLEGVVETKAGFMDGREVVQVTYDPTVISYEEVLDEGRKTRCADKAYVHNEQQARIAKQALGGNAVKSTANFRPDSQPKYYLAQTHYRAVPMTESQAARANALIGSGKSPDAVLSPRQIVLAKEARSAPDSKLKNRIGKDIMATWAW